MKDYQNWHNKKLILNNRKDLGKLFFREREVWWCALGENIGFEQDGKGEEFRRPVLIFKKFNQYVFLAVPLTTKMKVGKYYVSCKLDDETPRNVIISQLRLVDSKRLIDKIGTVNEVEFNKIKTAIKNMF